MRKIGVFCVIITAILGLCIVSSYAGDKPGDQLTEVFKKDIKPEVSLIPAGVKIAEDFIRQAPDQWAMFYPVWPFALEEMP